MGYGQQLYVRGRQEVIFTQMRKQSGGASVPPTTKKGQTNAFYWKRIDYRATTEQMHSRYHGQGQIHCTGWYYDAGREAYL